MVGRSAGRGVVNECTHTHTYDTHARTHTHAFNQMEKIHLTFMAASGCVLIKGLYSLNSLYILNICIILHEIRILTYCICFYVDFSGLISRI